MIKAEELKNKLKRDVMPINRQDAKEEDRRITVRCRFRKIAAPNSCGGRRKRFCSLLISEEAGSTAQKVPPVKLDQKEA